MKILRPAAAAAALTASFAFSAHSQAADADATQLSRDAAPVTQSVDNTYSVARAYEIIRADVTKAEFTGEEMLGRIDNLVSRIDTLMASATENNNELGQLRNATLQMRGQVVDFLKGNGAQLVQLDTQLPPAPSIVPSVGQQLSSEFPVVEGTFPGQVATGAPVGGGGGGAIGGGGGGGGGFAGGGGLGALGAAGAAAAAIAIDDDDDDFLSPGTVASQSTP